MHQSKDTLNTLKWHQYKFLSIILSIILNKSINYEIFICCSLSMSKVLRTDVYLSTAVVSTYPLLHIHKSRIVVDNLDIPIQKS